MNLKRSLRHFSILLCLLLCSSCATVQNDELAPLSEPLQEEIADELTVQLPDSACSYFYLLWGTHAEDNRQYQEAEEAFEKALICDPDSRYILRRLPFLLLRMGKPHGAAKWLRQAIEQFPEDIQDRILLARLAIQNNEFDEAIRLYREVLKITPDDETLLLRIGFLYSEQNRFAEAEEIFKEAFSLNPNSPFAHLYLARLANRAGQKKKAGKYYQQALTLNWSVDLAIEVAEFYGSQKEYKKVERVYRSILQKHPQENHAGLGLVHVLLLQDKEKEALAVLQDLRQNSSDTTQIDTVTARLHIRSGNLDKAIAILQPLALQDDIQEAVYMLAVIRYQQKNMESAQNLLRKIKSSSVFYEDALSLQVRIFMEEEQLTKATAILQYAIDDDASVSPGIYTLLASLYMEQGMFKKGYNTLDAALEVYPEDTSIHFEYGLILEKENKKELAIARMSEILHLDPDHAEALNYIGYTWADLGINLEQALQYIKRAVELKPDNGYIRDSLGWVYFRMGELEEAAREISAALELEPSDPHIHEHLGDIYHKLGHTEKTRQAYKKAQQLYKTEEKQTQMQDRIDAL